jgi:hypothetical protein
VHGERDLRGNVWVAARDVTALEPEDFPRGGRERLAEDPSAVRLHEADTNMARVAVRGGRKVSTLGKGLLGRRVEVLGSLHVPIEG